MKKLLFLIVCFFYFGSSYAQQVFPAAADNPEWITRYTISYPGNITHGIENFTYEDSVTICGIKYMRILATNLSSDIYIREANQKVYIRYTGDCSRREYVLYDFSMLPEDTIYAGYAIAAPSPSSIYYSDSTRFILDSITTGVYLGQTRRVFNVKFDFYPNHPNPALANNYFSTKWIEGIGSIIHPFHAVYPVSQNYNVLLLCSFSNGQHIYGNSAQYCPVMTSEEDIETFTPTLYPNPTKDRFTITLPPSETAFAVQLLDLTGRIIYSSSLFTSANQLEYGISLPPVQAGVYAVRISNETKQATLKLAIK